MQGVEVAAMIGSRAPRARGSRAPRARGSHRHVLAVAALTAALGSATAFAGLDGPVPSLQTTATPQRVDVPVRVSAYPVYNAHGHQTGTARWRISPAGGNCCETYVSATPTGRIVESGGTYPWYTDDEGKTWYQVKFDVPDQNDNGKAVAGGEGATVVGPAGNIYGVTWDAYSGDHLQAYRYTAQGDSWQVAEVVMKSPFYDRPWLTYAQGPYTLDGEKTKRVLDVTGGGITKNVDTLSPDGLDYGDPSYFAYDEQQTDPGTFRIPVVKNPSADWWQPHPGAHTLPLTAGGVLRLDNTDDLTGQSACPVARLEQKTATWQCVKMAATFQGVVRQDSRGYLTEVHPAGGTALVLATSRDGGEHWNEVTLEPPHMKSAHLEGNSGFELYNVVANGALGQAAVVARFDDAKHKGHDMVFRVDISKGKPSLLKTYAVGLGDVITANDVSGSTGYRFDYESVALLRNGHIALTFDDSTCLQPSLRDPTRRSPEVAILVG